MDDDSALQKSPVGAVESDPKKRYWRFEDVLGRGAFKTVFKAFDSREGTEVAWNKLPLTTAVNEDPLKKRLFSEIHVLKRLKHKNIMTFHDYWLDDKTNTLNFITELFTHGSLKKFRAKHKHLELKVLKKWAWQILQGLVYLHGHEPPIIHRDLKCDNILINGVTGDLKIGDLGLATLFRGLEAPLSVIGTPEFMAPEFYIEKYDEKVDVYAFGMLLLELVSMDYPYCECTNPAAIYKRVSQGVFPASIQKIRNEELRKFIELCIAYQPDARPEARKLLKHDFFNDIRRTMKPERPHSDEMDAETNARGSDFGGSADSLKGDGLSRNGSALIPSPSASEEEPEDNDQSVATSNGVKITIECSKVEGEPTLNFTLKYTRPGGVPKNIQFPFDIDDDTAEQIVAEMRAEGSTDLDIMITEEEASIIGHLIAMEVERWKLKDEGEFTGYVCVMRKTCDNDEPPGRLMGAASVEAIEIVESELDNMCQSVATDLRADHVFRTLDEKTRALMDYVQADNSRRSVDYAGGAISRRSVDHAAMEHSRRSIKHKLEIISDEYRSGENFSETTVLFSGRDEFPAPLPEEPEDFSEDETSVSSGAIDIPQKRRISTSSLEPSHSVSSTLSETFSHTPSRGFNSALGRSFQKRLSGRMSATDGSSINATPSFLRSRSVTLEGSSATESPLKVCSPQVPVELSLVVVEPKTESESPIVSGMETGLENEVWQEARQGTNTSLISMVTMKQTPSKKAMEVSMPTVPELPTPDTSQTIRPNPSKSDASLIRLVADEWQWTLDNGPFSVEAEPTPNLSQTLSVGVSPRRSSRRFDSSGNTVDHGIKSPTWSQGRAARGRSDTSVPRMLPLKTTEGAGASRPSSVGIGQSIEEMRALRSLEHVAGPHPLMSHHHPLQHHCEREEILSKRLGMALQPTKHPRSATADSLDFKDDFLLPSSPSHCRSSYDLTGTWDSESIRAFRRDEGAAVVAGPSFTSRRGIPWPRGQGSEETKQRANRLFNSYSQLDNLYHEKTGLQPRPLSNATSFDNSIQPSPSGAALAHLADPHPYLNHSRPIPRRGSHPEDARMASDFLKTGSDVTDYWTDFEADTMTIVKGKQQRSHSKELRREQAAENSDKMQPQQLAGLCHGVAGVGMASNSKSNGNKDPRGRSMNGPVHL